MNKLDLETKLIDANALIEFARSHVNGMIDCNDIARFPAVEAESARHGRWIWIFNRLVERFIGEECYESGWECSECGAASTMTIGLGREKPDYENFLKEMHDERTNYCPNCGAKMDLED